MTTKTVSAWLLGSVFCCLPVAPVGAVVGPFRSHGEAVLAAETHADPVAARVVQRELPIPGPLVTTADAQRAVASADPLTAAMMGQFGGDWRAEYDELTGLPSIVSGSGLPVVPGAGNSLAEATPPSLDLIEGRVRSILASLSAFHGIQDRDLTLAPERSGSFLDGRVWYVDFDRNVNRVPVYGSRVYARINSGNLIQLGFDLPLPIEPIEPALAAETALGIARDYAGGRDATDEPVNPGRLEYRVYRDGDGLSARLVWTVVFRKAGSIGTWTAVVDARAGDIVEFYDNNRYTSGTVTGRVHPRTVGDTDVTRPFPNEVVSVRNRNTTTDAAGAYTSAQTGNVVFSFKAVTPPGGFQISRDACGANASVTDTSNAAVVNLEWTDANSRADERNASYHLNVIRTLARTKLTTVNWLNSAVPVRVCINQTCNAYWDGATINLFTAGGGCSNTGEISDVVQHEWGHGIDQQNGGVFDSAGGEGIGDVGAWLNSHDPILAPRFQDPADPTSFGPMDDYTALRDASKLISRSNIAERCPPGTGCTGSLGYQCHCEGILFSGACWDLKELLAQRTGDPAAAYDMMARLHFVSMPSWQTHPQAADAMLAVDDDDGNLNNGTPNGCLIHQAFNRHGTAGRNVACSTPLVQLSFVSGTVLDPSGDSDGFAEPGETVSLRLRLHNGGNASAAAATATVSTIFPGVAVPSPVASFPALTAGADGDSIAHVAVSIGAGVACGSLVPFDVIMRNGASVYTARFSIVIGAPLSTVYGQDFEAGAGGWTGSTGDATTGQWIRGTPRVTASDGDVWQSAGCPQGTRCFYTGANTNWPDIGIDDVDDGTSIAESPEIDLSSSPQPVLQFRYWYTASRAGVEPTDILEIEVGNGATTASVFTEDAPESEWRFASIPLAGKIALTPTMRVRFKATDGGNGSITEAGVDDVKIVNYFCGAGNGCAYTADLTPSGPTTLCRGETVELAAGVSGCAGTPSYAWRRDGGSIAGATAASYTTPDTLTAGTYLYAVDVDCSTAPGCLVSSDPIPLVVEDAAAVIAPPARQDICYGSTPSLDGSASAVLNCPGGPAYQWVLDGLDVALATAEAWTVPSSLAPGDHTAEIRVACASPPFCSATSAPVTLGVSRVSAGIAGSSPIQACSGRSITLDAAPSTAENCPSGLTFQWMLGGADVPGATGSTYTTPPLAAGTHAYAVRVVCASLPGCQSTSSAIDVIAGAGTAPDVTANSLRAVPVGPDVVLAWDSSSGAGTWNAHRSSLEADVPALYTVPPLASAAARTYTDSAPSPGPLEVFFYQVFGADCAGISKP